MRFHDTRRHLSGALLALLSISSGRSANTSTELPGSNTVDTQRIVHANREPGNWMSVGRTYDEQRFSPLRQINERSVRNLGLAWSYDLNTLQSVQSTPVVVDGVLYSTSTWTVTVALDARTGKELWRYDPKVSRGWARHVCCGISSRGLAVWEGRIIIATLDGRLIALDARTGTPIWTTMTFDKEWPYAITGAPRAFNGKVVIGNAGAEYGVRGYVSAYDVNTGQLIWRFWTVPGNPAEGFENKAMEMAAKTWSGQWWLQGGGGTVWDSIVYDPEFNRVYFGTGNGTPWPHKLRSEGKGDNLFLASVVALNADTGEYIWHYQMIPADSWDFDVTQPLILADLRIHARKRKVIMQAPKHGFFYVIDRMDGKLISAEKFLELNNFASHIDIASGRPVLLPSANYDNEPRLITPSPDGAHSWQPMSYSPKTRLVYFPVLEFRTPLEIEPNFQARRFLDNRGTFAPPSDANAPIWKEYLSQIVAGYLIAWDPVRQREVWRAGYNKGGNGGTLTTGGNLVAHGTSDQTFAIYRATDGTKLWEKAVQTVPTAGPMTYMVDGEQYIAVAAGGGGFDFNTRERPINRSSGRILAFKLGARVELPPQVTTRAAPRAPVFERHENSKEQVALGSVVYHRNCASCHGPNAVSITAVPDLRYISPETHAQFKDIVLKGVRSESGMQSFGGLLTEMDADAILSYLSSRAWENWEH